jgi:membrane dipeptidase
MSYPIADLHCDLLSYLEKGMRTPYDSVVRCSVSQLRAGKVKYQVLAVFAETGLNSVKHGLAQLAIYKNLPALYPKVFSHSEKLQAKQSNKIPVLMAFEGASAFCAEDEPIEVGLQRLKSIIKEIAKPVYISLTWNTENRFGGGTLTTTGLKEDGKRLLEELHQQGIAIDLSHASDALAYDILNYMDQQQLDLPIVASHSNSRVVHPVPRNLPDDIAQEIFHRNGLIGLNFYRPFVGADESFFVKHLAHWIALGGKKHVCFGADFFYEQDFTLAFGHGVKDLFFPHFQDASCYSRLLSLFHKELHLSEDELEGLASKNLLRFWQENGF